MKLYEITNSLISLEKAVEDKEELKNYLDGVNMQLEEKAKNLFMYIKNIETPILAIDEEIKRLTEIKNRCKKNSENIKEYIAYNMKKANIEKIETDIVKFSFRKSKSLEITDESRIPKEFIKEKIVTSVDKMAIKNALKQGETVTGAELVENINLSIK